MVYGLWFMVYGLWFMVYGLWFMVYGQSEFPKKTDSFTSSMQSIFIYSLLVDITPTIRKIIVVERPILGRPHRNNKTD